MRTPLVPILRVGYFEIFQGFSLIYPLLDLAQLSNVLLSTKVLFNFEPCPGLSSPFQLRSSLLYYFMDLYQTLYNLNCRGLTGVAIIK